MTKPTRPLFDTTGWVIARISPTTMQHLGQLVVECDAGHLYTADALSVKRGTVAECPKCHESVDNDLDAA